jgi:hypothetical protein
MCFKGKKYCKNQTALLNLYCLGERLNKVGLTVFYVVAVGTTTARICVLRNGTTTIRRTGTTMSVSGWCAPEPCDMQRQLVRRTNGSPAKGFSPFAKIE